MSKVKHKFANAYLTIYKQAVEEYKATKWYQFKKRDKIMRKVRWSRHHYKLLTGKQI
jgi:hypothetical protein